jgi:glycosyltransferase involved in cell wall biosynthesis
MMEHMMKWDVMAGGRCLDKPWRVGIAAVACNNPEQIFTLSQSSWQDFLRELPWLRLKAYGAANGLTFEPVAKCDKVIYDGLLLLQTSSPGRLLPVVDRQVRRYLLLRGNQPRFSPDHEASFARIFAPLGEPFTDGRLVCLNQPLNISAQPSKAVRWVVCDDQPELPGLLSRKWRECLESGCVPAHLGDWPVPGWVPQGSYIDARDCVDQSMLEDHCAIRVSAAAKVLQSFLADKSSYPYSSDCWIAALSAAIACDASVVRENIPLLSVIIPTYNHGRFLRQAVASVLEQGYENIEVLVLDNASTDNTREIMHAFASDRRIRYMCNPRNIGPSYNVLNGIQIARGRYLSTLMADDYYNPGYLSRLLPRLLEKPEAVVGYTAIRWVNEGGQALAMPRHPGYGNEDYAGGRNEVAELLVNDNYIPPSAALIQREPFLKIWRRDPQLKGAGDWLSMLQIAEQHPDFIFMSDAGVTYRAHAGQLSTEFYASNAPLADHVRLVEGVFERRSEGNLRGREHDVADHLRRRLALYPDEEKSPLGERVRLLCQRLDALAALDEHALFSIILTTYNRPPLLKDALASIGRQTLRDFEVILINDNGEPVENVLDICDFRVTYVRQGRNQGLSAARNTGLKLARGRYIAYLDDDDLYLPDHLAVLAEAFNQHPQSVVYTGVEYVVERIDNGKRIELGRSTPFAHTTYNRERLFVQNYIPVNTWSHPRDMLLEVGDFDTGLTAFEDWDMLMRLAARHPFVHVPQVTAEVRLRDASNTGSDHMLGREQKNFGALYQKMYRRHSDLASKAVREARNEMLKRVGVSSQVEGNAVSLPEVSSDDAEYHRWMNARSLSTHDDAILTDTIAQRWATKPRVHLLLRVMPTNLTRLADTLESLNKQIYRNWQVDIVATFPVPAEAFLALNAIDWHEISSMGQAADTLNLLVMSHRCELIAELPAGAVLNPQCLFRISQATIAPTMDPTTVAWYCDDDLIDIGGMHHAPRLKPALDAEWMCCADLLGPVFVSAPSWHAVGGASVDATRPWYDLALRVVDANGAASIGHVAEPLLSLPASLQLEPYADKCMAAVRRSLTRRKHKGKVIKVSDSTWRIDYAGPTPPVTIALPCRDKPEYLAECVDLILAQTTYPDYEIVVVDGGSQERQTLALFEQLKQRIEAQVRVVRTEAPFTLASFANTAAAQAQGELLLLLADDVRVLRADWMNVLVRHGVRDDIGCVGPILLKPPAGQIDHAGFVLGLGGFASSPQQGEPLADSPGYLEALNVQRSTAALSAACMLVRIDDFRSVAGMDAAAELTSYADIDFCLRLGALGKTHVVASELQLVRLGASSLEPQFNSAIEIAEIRLAALRAQEAMFHRWFRHFASDRYCSRHLDRSTSAVKLEMRGIPTWHAIPCEGPRIMAFPVTSAQGLIRITQPLMALRRAGKAHACVVDRDPETREIPLVHDLARHAPDAIVAHQLLGPASVTTLHQWRTFLKHTFLVYQLDDLFTDMPSMSSLRSGVPADARSYLARALRDCDRLVVSTDYLAEAYRDYIGDIRVVPNRLERDVWLPLKSRRRTTPKPRVGWAGGTAHAGDLRLIIDVVAATSKEIDWVFMGMCPDELRPYIKEFHPFTSYDEYPARLAALNLDLAVAPLEQIPFNRGKSNLRLLEYGVLGIPVVCTDIDPYQNSPACKVPNNSRAWLNSIRERAHDPVAAALEGEQMRRWVLEHYILEDHLDEWMRAHLPD